MTMTVERPTTRTLLPFRAETFGKGGYPMTVLHYEGDIRHPDGSIVRIPYTEPVGNTESGQVVHPRGAAILALMKMFWDLEASQDGVLKERDDLLQENIKLKAELERLSGNRDELQRRVERLTKKG